MVGFYELEDGVDFKGWGAGLVTVAVGTVVGVGGAGYVAEARGQRGVNDVEDALSSVVEVGWVCWILTLIEGEGAAAGPQHILHRHEEWQECCRLGAVRCRRVQGGCLARSREWA